METCMDLIALQLPQIAKLREAEVMFDRETEQVLIRYRSKISAAERVVRVNVDPTVAAAPVFYVLYNLTNGQTSFITSLSTFSLSGNQVNINGEWYNVNDVILFKIERVATPSSYDSLTVSGNVGIGTENPAAKLDVRGGDAIFGGGILVGVDATTPQNVSATPQAGGNLAPGTYYYKVVAYAGSWNSAPSAEVSAVVDGTHTGSILISWSPVPGAEYYRVYRGTSSNNQDQWVYASPETFIVDDGSLTWNSGSPPSVSALPSVIVDQYGIDSLLKRFRNTYISQNPVSACGIGLPMNRLLGATHRYSVTSSGFLSNASIVNIFDGAYVFNARIAPDTAATLEIDVRPSINYNLNTPTGIIYPEGLLVISFYDVYYATEVKVDVYHYDQYTTLDRWVTIFWTKNNNQNPLIIPVPAGPMYLKKMKFTFRRPDSEIRITEIEYFPYRQMENWGFSSVPVAHPGPVSVWIPVLTFRDTSNSVRAYIKSNGEAQFRRPITTTYSSITLGTYDYTVLVDASAGARTITLPPVADSVGVEYIIKKIDSSSNAVIIDPNATELIEGATTISLTTQWQFVRIQSNGNYWVIIGR